jgi:hypothetical protein
MSSSSIDGRRLKSRPIPRADARMWLSRWNMPSLLFYRIARTGGYSVSEALKFAVFKLRLPDRPEHLKREMNEYLERLSQVDDNEVRPPKHTSH